MINLLSVILIWIGVLVIIDGVLIRYFSRSEYYVFFAGLCIGLIVFNLLTFLVQP